MSNAATNPIRVGRELRESLDTVGWQHYQLPETRDPESVMSFLGELCVSLSSPWEEPELSFINTDSYVKGKYLANTQASMSLHTDNIYLRNPCRYVILFCINQAEIGGSTVLSDIRDVATKIDPAIYDELLNPQWLWSRPTRIGKGLCPSRAVIDNNGGVRWWRRGLKNDNPELLDIADTFDDLLRNIPGNTRLKLEPNGLVITDNHRILHGRDSFTGDNRKFIRARIW